MSSSSSTSTSELSNILRLTPLSLTELPSHASLPSSAPSTTRPSLVTFLGTLLSAGTHFLSRRNFSTNFQLAGCKRDPPFKDEIEVHKREVTTAQLDALNWEGPGVAIPRPQPRGAGGANKRQPEHWFSRRSRHANVSSNAGGEGSACWDEFVYGLRDDHSRHEYDFTPTLYDAHHILDWNDQVRALVEKEEGAQIDGRYSHITLAIYEMCHAIPAPLQPRCFPVLVCTASTGPTSFIAVTVPVDLTGLDAAFYSSKRNVKEGKTAQERKSPVFGAYAAVETVVMADTGDGDEGKKNEIEWTMATASDARGSLPMWVQKMSMPGAVVKDVGYFLKWIRTVPEEQLRKQGVGTH